MAAMSHADTQASGTVLRSRPDNAGPEPLPRYVAMPLIAILAAGSWALVWAAGRALVLLLG